MKILNLDFCTSFKYSATKQRLNLTQCRQPRFSKLEHTQKRRRYIKSNDRKNTNTIFITQALNQPFHTSKHRKSSTKQPDFQEFKKVKAMQYLQSASMYLGNLGDEYCIGFELNY